MRRKEVEVELRVRVSMDLYTFLLAKASQDFCTVETVIRRLLEDYAWHENCKEVFNL